MTSVREFDGEINKRAADWIVRRDAGSLPAQEQALEAWLEADIRHRVAYLRLNAAWERSQMAERLRPLQGPVNKDLFAPKRHAVVPGRRFALAAAIATVAVTGAVWWGVVQSQWQSYSTSVGAFERVRLQDGSTVELNTGSEVRVRLSDARREIVLTRGEARFSVARDPRRPFDVRAGDKTVRALGTAFTVRLRDRRQIDLLVTEGQVLLEGGGSAQSVATPSVLSAGQLASVRPGAVRVAVVQPAAMTRRLAWTEGKLVFHEETLAEAVAEFNRYNTRPLVVRDAALNGLRVGGTFEATDTNSFLAALQRVFGVPAGAVAQID